jgi:hypothetical protein
MLLILSSSGHDPNKLVEVSDELYKRILEVQGERYLQDTEEGRALIEELEALPEVPAEEITIYI